MTQQLIALIIIGFFLSRLFLQKRKKEISSNEFIFWLIFWISATLAIVFLKQIDSLVAGLGFSSSGIDVLFYLAVVVLVYFVFRLRLRLEKQERNITSLVKEIALKRTGKE